MRQLNESLLMENIVSKKDLSLPPGGAFFEAIFRFILILVQRKLESVEQMFLSEFTKNDNNDQKCLERIEKLNSSMVEYNTKQGLKRPNFCGDFFLNFTQFYKKTFQKLFEILVFSNSAPS